MVLILGMTDPLDDLLAEMPPPEASEAEIEIFMEKVMVTPGGRELIQGFAEKITEGGSLDTMLKEEEAEQQSLTLSSSARFVFRIELPGSKPLIWRRISLPSDCAYFHLHLAIQDAFGWQGRSGHRFEVWEEGDLELTFGPEEEMDQVDYCEVQNRIVDLFSESVFEFQYLYDFEDRWRHRVVIEEFVPAGEKGTTLDVSAHLHDGAGHGPPEGCGGISGFQDFLKGDHSLCQNYEAEVLEEFRSGSPDLLKITFRDPCFKKRS